MKLYIDAQKWAYNLRYQSKLLDVRNFFTNDSLDKIIKLSILKDCIANNIMTLLTNSTWHNDDYVNDSRLIEYKLVIVRFYEVDEWTIIYMLGR